MTDRTDFDDLSAWAESDAAVAAVEDAVQTRGLEYRTEESDTIEQEFARAGRPSLNANPMGNGASPRRQVRLPHDLNDALDRYAAETGTSASHIMRLALERFLSNPAA
ncbi:CopG family transcriptional regulator [Corynebacterium sp. 320]|uniref:CopG family transcriptional regulator n=1 Tax=Corynebacterium zhongnanshanii TaxID=2768834 RepID=A0ABQ6VEZ9_9CORY|nr:MULTISPECIES: ribbon-helix-helix protein, CopG family [Corynebacterium]KAB1504139.1 CopG family transcriptional regulator [Corynebacterium sp. 320]KAB1552761.1 CopG family transcriptional regulator [Corynebacterium sp. 321]KAB1554021.1 CopG family transcriptional regulator [Corynebacterium sp. 319]KAB3523007.1 CopG family transcriptional regulator [Corynebacterium zhongnanshanii]KAB3528275.1 CopG family transcriptional regulator [Corynebacterium sp. 250]